MIALKKNQTDIVTLILKLFTQKALVSVGPIAFYLLSFLLGRKDLKKKHCLGGVMSQFPSAWGGGGGERRGGDNKNLVESFAMRGT